MYSNYCCSCSFEPEIIKIGQSLHNMYSNNILNFLESTAILNASTKKSGNLLKASRTCPSISMIPTSAINRITPHPNPVSLSSANDEKMKCYWTKI